MAMISFSGTIDGGTAGDQGAGASNAGTGTISLSGSVGGTTPLGALTLTDATLKIGSGVNITTSDANFSESGNTLFLGATATTSTIATGNGTIAFSGTIDGSIAGDQALSFNAGTGTITLSGSVGGATPLGAIALTDATLEIGGGVGIATSDANVLADRQHHPAGRDGNVERHRHRQRQHFLRRHHRWRHGGRSGAEP